MLIKYRIARVQPPSFFGGILHVTLVAPNTSSIAASSRTVLLLLEWRLPLLFGATDIDSRASSSTSHTTTSIRRHSHCHNVYIAFETKSIFNNNS